MAQAKSELFDPGLQSLAVLLKALGHPARLAILQHLSRMNACMTGDICDELPLGRTTVNQHLRELKAAGLIRGSIDGVKVNYCLDPDGIRKLRCQAGAFFEKLIAGNETPC